MKKIINQTYDEERALYASDGVICEDCTFAGPADGESAFKESKNLIVRRCDFKLRYPFWHNGGVCITRTELTPLCRAALWYSENIEIEKSKLHGIKALRECSNISMWDCSVVSAEFGWFVHGIDMERCSVTGEYFMLRSDKLNFNNVSLKGKYSFQYIEDSVFENCNFDTKDAFWHAKNVTVKNSVVKGEYLAWYSDGLTLIDCKIIGTQPLCYCKGLKLINCTTEGCDLSFEYSEVDATVKGNIVSVKNPLSGKIVADSIGEIVHEGSVKDCNCEIVVASTL